jgi:hypothetical protein
MIEFGPKSPALAFDEAWLYCATLTHNNKYDWRMTNYDEYYDSNMNEIMYGYGWVDDGSIHEEELAVFIDSVMPVRTKDD